MVKRLHAYTWDVACCEFYMGTVLPMRKQLQRHFKYNCAMGEIIIYNVFGIYCVCIVKCHGEFYQTVFIGGISVWWKGDGPAFKPEGQGSRY